MASKILYALYFPAKRSWWVDITLVLMELELAAVHKTQKKEKRKIGQYPAILTSHWSIRRTECRCEWVKINLQKIVAILKHLQMRHSLWMISYITYRCIFICVWIWTNSGLEQYFQKAVFLSTTKTTTTITTIIGQLWMWSFVLPPADPVNLN